MKICLSISIGISDEKELLPFSVTKTGLFMAPQRIGILYRIIALYIYQIKCYDREKRGT